MILLMAKKNSADGKVFTSSLATKARLLDTTWPRA